MSIAHPSTYAKTTPEKPAYISVDTGDVITYAELDRYSSKGANLFRSLGVQPGEHIAILSENHPEFFALIWSAQRAGIIFTAVSSHLRASEIAYIVDNCDAKVLVTTKKMEILAKDAVEMLEREIHTFSIGGSDNFESWSDALEVMPTEPSASECAGVHMLYSSGTTGHPKGVYPTWESERPIEHIEPGMAALRDFFGINKETVYLSPAPLYHAAPLIFNQLVMFQGGTSVIMEKFDPEKALMLIDKYQVNMGQFVPIMFVRMLKLAPEIREKYDVSSMEKAIHAAAPCPVKIKQQMIDWWGPNIFEYYSSTENAGATLLTTEQWLAHPGSVGLPLGCAVHILGEDGEELPINEIGEVYFENPHANFEYYKEPEKTAGTRNDKGWITVGDMGYVDEDGYLYLTDRKDFMIISGGVNIYPQEVENQLILHPKVADAAVFGIPNEEFGQEVKAVVQPMVSDFNEFELAEELMAWCRENISTVKCPRSIDFDLALPRLDNGKLYKNQIADRYRDQRLGLGAEAKLALVTGAAGGIGFCLSTELAAHGYDILAVDQDEEGLARLKAKIASPNNRASCQTHVMDLARLESAQELYDHCKTTGQTIDVLVNNVGFGKMGEHIEQDPSIIQKMVTLNNILLMELCLLFGKDMKTRGTGKILNVASLVGFSASPYFAAYSGTKASTIAFSTAFGQEMLDHGVSVSCLCPSTTETQFLNTAAIDSAASRGMRRFASAWVSKPDLVAREGVKGLMKGKLVIVPTLFLKVQAAVLGAMPASFISGFVKRRIQKANAGEARS